MPQYQSYARATIESPDVITFYDDSAGVLKTIEFSDIVATIETLLDGAFTLESVVPSDVPAAGEILIGNAGGTAYEKKAVSGDIAIDEDGITTIQNNSVSYAKMQNVSAESRLLGRGQGSGAGDPVEITLGSGLSMTANELRVSSGIGNVTQASNASEANHVFVSGGTDKTRLETPVEIDPVSGDITGAGDIDATGIIGTDTDDDADAGNVGEYVESKVPIGSASSLTDDTPANITSVSLDAGDWDVSALVSFSASSPSASVATAGITISSATIPTDGTEVNMPLQGSLVTASVPRVRFKLNSTTTVYLVGVADFSSGTVDGYGFISARRVR